MIRAYHDPALTHPVSRDGSWLRAVEFLCGRNMSRTRKIWIHNAGSASVLLKLSAQVSGFAITIPPSINLQPGVTPLEVTVAAGALPLPTAYDFRIIGTVDVVQTGKSGFTQLDYTDDGYMLESHVFGGDLLKIEATAFCLPVGDERFNDLNPSPLASIQSYTDYIAKGMGFVNDDYRDTVVRFMGDHLRDWGLWALNKHYMFGEAGPMRHVRDRANSIGYRPPGVPSLHPALRRRVYARAYDIARKLGSEAGIRAVFEALGIPQAQLGVYREGFVWHILIPQWVAATYSEDFLGNLALYHVDPYSVINITVNEDTFDRDYTDIDYMVEPGHAVQPPDTGTGAHLVLEEGGAYLLTEDGLRIELESTPTGLSESDVTYNGQAVSYGGEQVIYTSDNTVTYDGERVTHNGDEITY